MSEILEKNDAIKVYEIGYLIISSVPAEKMANIVASLKDILLQKGAVMIGEEAAELRELAYQMVKKIGSANHRFDHGYFGWLKFELSSAEIEGVKKQFEMHPDMLRMLLMTTVKENTYLGKKAAVVATIENPVEGAPAEVSAEVPVNESVTETLPIPGLEEKVASAQTSIEELDKSIDEMVKGA